MSHRAVNFPRARAPCGWHDGDVARDYFDGPVRAATTSTSRRMSTPRSSRPPSTPRGAGGRGAGPRAWDRTGTPRPAARGPRLRGARHRPVGSDARGARQEARCRSAARHGRRLLDDRAQDSFTLAFLAFNTITNLTSQDEQVACFERVARHLAPGGRFVVECYIPELRRLPPGETIHPFDVTPTHLGFEEYDLATQIAILAPLAGGGDPPDQRGTVPLRVAERARPDGPPRGDGAHRAVASFAQDPFTAESRSHVSVWQRPT